LFSATSLCSRTFCEVPNWVCPSGGSKATVNQLALQVGKGWEQSHVELPQSPLFLWGLEELFLDVCLSNFLLEYNNCIGGYIVTFTFVFAIYLN
jgi:hypothetical protein